MINVISDESTLVWEKAIKKHIHKNVMVSADSFDTFLLLSTELNLLGKSNIYFIRVSLNTICKLYNLDNSKNDKSNLISPILTIVNLIKKVNISARILIMDFSEESINNYNLNIVNIDSNLNLSTLLNYRLYDLSQQDSLISLIPNESIFPIQSINHFKHYILTKTSMTFNIALNLTLRIKTFLDNISSQIPKLIILDLDGTIWDGVLAEDPEKIRIGGHDHIGEGFEYFQKFLLEAKKKGILLAVVSKNEEDDFLGFFNSNLHMPLKIKDFVTWRVNWIEKSTNIISILKELNISASDTLFLDNSLGEQKEVKFNVPEIKILNLDDDIFSNMFKLTKILPLKYITTTLEDNERTELYRARKSIQTGQEKNAANAQNSTKYINWLTSIKLRLDIQTTSQSDFNQRILQLFQRTNQFNFLGKHYSELDISNLLNQGSHLAWGSITSIHGNEGIVIAAIFKPGEVFVINQYVMSCRVFGRYIEYAFLKYLLKKYKVLESDDIKASIIEGDKNKAAIKFFKSISNTSNKQRSKDQAYYISHEKILQTQTSFISTNN